LYKFIDGEYVLQSDGSTSSPTGKNPYWMPEIGLAIGTEKQTYRNYQREWLYWYDENYVRSPTPTERAEAIKHENEIPRQRLRELGVDPDSLTGDQSEC
jgi:hypothetical protein